MMCFDDVFFFVVFVLVVMMKLCVACVLCEKKYNNHNVNFKIHLNVNHARA